MMRLTRYFISLVLLIIGLTALVTVIQSKIKIQAAEPVKTFDVRIFFGYKDARPARFVADRYEMAIFLQKLTEPCESQRQDCGFNKSESNEDGETETPVFYKIIKNKSGQKMKVNLRIFTSSVGADDNDNRKNPFQHWRSEFMRDQFTQALKLANVVFYNGHSRAGGGPDFSVPLLTENNHVHYEDYQQKKSGLKLIYATLKQNPQSSLQQLGLYSCRSDQLFRKKVEAARPGLQVISSSQLLYFSDAFNDSLDRLSQILENI